jgi:hypothetical protein
MTHYIIRQIAYFYSDEYLFPVGEGGIFKVFHDADSAMKAYRRAEITAFRRADLGDIEPLSPCSTDGKAVQKALDDYFMATFKTPLLRPDGEYTYVQMETYIPKKATDEQVWAIKEITGIAFYTFSKFEEEPVFYRIIQEDKADYAMFYNTQQDAITKSIGDDYTMDIDGELGDLSHTPAILEHLLQDSKNVSYDATKKNIEFAIFDRSETEINKMIAIIAVMKPEVIRIEAFSLKQAQAIDHDIFEEM